MIYVWYNYERTVHIEDHPEFVGGTGLWRGSDTLCDVFMLNTVTRSLRHGEQQPHGSRLCVKCHAESTTLLTS